MLISFTPDLIFMVIYVDFLFRMLGSYYII